VRADLAMENGRVDIRTLDLDSTTYAVSASGELNFREDTARVPIEVNAIRGVASLVEYVPVAGDALKIVNVRLVATGSPWDMEVHVASISDQLLGASLAGPKAVINGMRDAVNLMRRGSGNPDQQPATAPEAEPSPGPAPPPGAETP